MLQVSVLRNNPEWVKERLAVKNFKHPKLVDEIEGACRAAGLIEGLELILVCDSSPDDSWNVIKDLSIKLKISKRKK